MPEFELDVGQCAIRYRALDAFTQGYVECAFFCGVEGIDEANLHLGLLSDEAWREIEEDCAAFQVGNAAPLAAATEGSPVWPQQRCQYDMQRAGNDFWYTRNGHGVGYCDRGLPDDVEQALYEAATRAGESYMYTGDDGKLYIA
jgi:hypothetical protein